MLPVQSTLPFSDYSSLYDLLVPKTNLLRQINDLVDFSFIRKSCSQNIVQTTDVQQNVLSACSSIFFLRLYMTYLMLMWLSIPCMICPSNTFWVWYPKRLP